MERYIRVFDVEFWVNWACHTQWHRGGIVCAKDGKYLSASSFFGGNNQAKSNGVGSGAREQGVNVAGCLAGWGLWRAKHLCGWHMSHCARHNFAAKTLTLIIIVVVFLGGKLLYDATALSFSLAILIRHQHEMSIILPAPFAYYQKAHLAAGAVSSRPARGHTNKNHLRGMRQLTLTGGKIKPLALQWYTFLQNHFKYFSFKLKN